MKKIIVATLISIILMFSFAICASAEVSPKPTIVPKPTKPTAVEHEGSEYTDSKGRRVDEFGRLIDDKGRLINEEGHLIDEKGNLIDEDGNIIGENGSSTSPKTDDATVLLLAAIMMASAGISCYAIKKVKD